MILPIPYHLYLLTSISLPALHSPFKRVEVLAWMHPMFRGREGGGIQNRFSIVAVDDDDPNKGWGDEMWIRSGSEAVTREVPLDELPCWLHMPRKTPLFDKLLKGEQP